MTKAEALKNTNPEMIAKLFASNMSEQTLEPLRRFYRRRHKLPKEVIHAMIMYCIIVLGGKLPIAEEYYRVTQDDWKKREILTAETAITFFAESMEINKNLHKYREQMGSNSTKLIKPMKQVVIDPEINLALDNLRNRMR